MKHWKDSLDLLQLYHGTYNFRYNPEGTDFKLTPKALEDIASAFDEIERCYLVSRNPKDLTKEERQALWEAFEPETKETWEEHWDDFRDYVSSVTPVDGVSTTIQTEEEFFEEHSLYVPVFLLLLKFGIIPKSLELSHVLYN